MSQIMIDDALRKAVEHHQAGRLGDAEAVYRQVLAAQPNHADALHLLGLIALQVGQYGMAADLIRRAIAVAPGQPDYHCNLGNALHNHGQVDGAIAAYQEAIRWRPGHFEALNNLGNGLREKGETDQAIACYESALALKPDYAAAHNNLGMARRDKKQFEEAIACFQRALEVRPNYPEAYNNLGMALAEKGQIGQAVPCYQRALALKGDFIQAHYNLGNALREAEQTDLAIASYERALALKPDFFEAHNNLGMAWSDKRQLDKAAACFQRALALQPALVEAYNNLAGAWKDKGLLEEAVACYRKAIELKPDFRVAHDNLLFTLPYLPSSDRRSLFVEHQRWNKQHAAPLKRHIQRHLNDRDPERRLRIGYVSPDFRSQPVGRFMLPLLASHDRGAFEIFCYAQVRRPDMVTDELRPYADVWRDIVGMSDEEVAARIAQDRIDILVDLTMHMADNRLLVFARKPAPVQITYLAYAGGTAVDAIDYRLTDRYLDPDDADDAYYVEKSIRLEGTYWCYQQNITATPVNELPAMKSGHITLGCLNNFCKVTPATLELWAEVMRGMPDSRLLLHSPAGSDRERVLRFMEDQGIGRDRMEMADRVSLEGYFAMYHRIDIALDPIPYCGGTTTCDALWMGVPVVTLAGRTAVGRGGVTIMSNAGLPEMIATAPEEYIRIVKELAGDLPKLASLRASLRQQIASSTLMDGGRFAPDVEKVYRAVWRTWCENS